MKNPNLILGSYTLVGIRRSALQVVFVTTPLQWPLKKSMDKTAQVSKIAQHCQIGLNETIDYATESI